VTLSVAGCSTNTNSPSVSPSTEPGHDVVLNAMVQAIHDTRFSGNVTLVDWKVTWPNDTTAIFNSSVKGENSTLVRNGTLMRLPSNDDATEFVGDYNITGFSLISANSTAGGAYEKAYENATGHPPAVFRFYQKSTTTAAGPGVIDIIQLDNYVEVISSRDLR
jgi:hypothetical protein